MKFVEEEFQESGKETAKAGGQQDYQWLMSQVDKSIRYFKEWNQIAQSIEEEWHLSNARFSNGSLKQDRRSHIFWANTQVETPALYSRVPKVVSELREGASDPRSRVASLLIERSTSFQIEDSPRFNKALKKAVHDAQLSARAVVRVKYLQRTGTIDVRHDLVVHPDGTITTPTGDLIPEDVQIQQGETLDEIFYITQEEDLLDEYVDYTFWPRKDFYHSRSSQWADVWWVAYVHRLYKIEIEHIFGNEIADKAAYGKTSETRKENGDAEGEEEYKAKAIEVWCKRTRKIYWHVDGVREWAKVEEDPYGLREFFDCPEPLYFNTPNDKLQPTPIYLYYRPHAQELDRLMQKRYQMYEALEVLGIVDERLIDEVTTMKKLGNMKFLPVNAQLFAEAGGIQNAIQPFIVPGLAQTIGQLNQEEEKIKAKIYEISGLADIIRGVSDPRETAKAQQIKGDFATLRLADRQEAVQIFARDLIDLTAELIAEKFENETIKRIACVEYLTPEDQSYVEPALELLAQDDMRRIKLTIETDSTIAITEQLQKQAYNAFITSVVSNIQPFLQLITVAPELAGAIGRIWSDGARMHRIGKATQTALEEGFQNLTQRLLQPQPQQQQQPDPRMLEVQRKAQKDEKDFVIATEELKLKAQDRQDQRIRYMGDMQLEAAKVAERQDIARQRAGDRMVEKTIDALTR